MDQDQVIGIAVICLLGFSLIAAVRDAYDRASYYAILAVLFTLVGKG